MFDPQVYQDASGRTSWTEVDPEAYFKPVAAIGILHYTEEKDAFQVYPDTDRKAQTSQKALTMTPRLMHLFYNDTKLPVTANGETPREYKIPDQKDCSNTAISRRMRGYRSGIRSSIEFTTPSGKELPAGVIPAVFKKKRGIERRFAHQMDCVASALEQAGVLTPPEAGAARQLVCSGSPTRWQNILLVLNAAFKKLYTLATTTISSNFSDWATSRAEEMGPDDFILCWLEWEDGGAHAILVKWCQFQPGGGYYLAVVDPQIGKRTAAELRKSDYVKHDILCGPDTYSFTSYFPNIKDRIKLWGMFCESSTAVDIRATFKF